MERRKARRNIIITLVIILIFYYITAVMQISNLELDRIEEQRWAVYTLETPTAYHTIDLDLYTGDISIN